ncbi:MAG: hypothetical protein JNJ54_15235 [Myxococcaceae bacterium]|nr:hypothetical protein [Myxococcaceae bacterium]
MKRTFAVIGVVTLLGCGTPDAVTIDLPGDDAAQVEQATTGNVLRDKAYRNTVGWLYTSYWPTVRRGCVVVAVARNAVLSAGHCVTDDPSGFPLITIRFGDDVRYPETYIVEAKQVGGWKFAPDLGIVQLDRCYNQLVPARLLSATQFDQLQAESPSRWRYVGYQHVDPDRAGPRVHFAPVTLVGTGTSPYQTRSHPGMNVAVGDSGSPVFRDPSPIGTASTGLWLSGVMATTSRNASVPAVRDQLVSVLNALPPCPDVDAAADTVK